MTRRTTAAIASISALLALTACGQKREQKSAELDPGQAARFGLTPDAADPTQRNLDAGYYRWKEAPEAEGTYAPNSPERRMIGGPDDF